MRKRVTIVDVAHQADVSMKTVSNVLNHTGSMRPETRQRVETAIEQTGYRLNSSARAMRTGNTKLIGLGIADFTQPFYAALSQKVIDAARKRGYGVLISTYGLFDQDIRAIIDETLKLPADGWIFFTGKKLVNKGAILDQNYPVVLASDFSSYGKADLVTMPNAQAFQYVAGQLLDQGLRRIMVVGAAQAAAEGHFHPDKIVQGTRELRTKGYFDAFAERGLAVDPTMLVPVDELDYPSAVAAVDALVTAGLSEQNHPEVIMCMNDALALGVMHQLGVHGLSVPDDVQVVGFDNVPESAFSLPALTTIDANLDFYAQSAVDMLIDRIGGFAGPSRTVVTDFSVVRRDSTRF